MTAGAPISPESPLISVVVVTPRNFRNISKTVESLARQTISDKIELVIVTPERNDVAVEAAALNSFHSVSIIPVGPIHNVDHAAAPGLLRGSADIVASIEDHAFPDPDWAERVVAEWRAGRAAGNCVAIGSTVTNANPRSMLSWANILLAYGQWRVGTPAGPIAWVPAHNITVWREALQPLSNDLPKMMGREGLFLKEIQRRGGSFRFAPAARIAHVNPSLLSATAALRFDAGRLYAARRCAGESWGRAKRIAYVGFGPAIPFLRYARMRRELFAPESGLSERKLGAALFLGLVFDAAGQMLGYVAGAGGSPDRLAVFEMDRIAHLDAHDRGVFAPA